MEQADAGRILTEAIEALYEENIGILRLNVNERTICGQLRAILERSFKNHDVHAEYNLHGVDPKEIELPDETGVLTSSRVYPDIIVHQPGHDDENLIVIEVKKSTNPAPDQRDLIKLELIKQQLGYEHAVLMRLPTGNGANVSDVRVTWV